MKSIIQVNYLTSVVLVALLASCGGQKWTERQVDSFVIVEQKGGPTLGYSPESGVKLLTDGGYAFKDLNRNGKVDVYAFFGLLHSFVRVLPNDDSQMLAALGRRVRDFEDMLQYQCAKAAGCDVIVTNNGRDFAEFSDLPFMSAADFLRQLS